MRAGKLDREITIERATTAVGDAGTVTETWAPVASLRAELVETAADETDPATTKTTVLFRTRYVAGVTVADRIDFDGRYFNIKHVSEIGRRRGLELHAERLGP
jgi:SPP1 family predicted phage head-tail adaptor